MQHLTVTRGLRNISEVYSKIILDTNYYTSITKTSWNSYNSGISKRMIYAEEYQNLIDTRQYSFLLSDNSFFQFYYEWDNSVIVNAKLCYYPTPVKISNALESIREIAEECGVDLIEEFYYGVESFAERGIDLVNTSHIRMDYDSNTTSHSKCHIQISSVNEFRISSSYLINPFIFFEWIIRQLNFDEIETITKKSTYQATANFHHSRNTLIELDDNNYPSLGFMK